MDEHLQQYPQLREIARKMREQGASLDEVLAALRRECPSIIQSIKAVRDVFGIPLDEAKLLVEGSGVWSDAAANNERIHQQAESLYRESGG